MKLEMRSGYEIEIPFVEPHARRLTDDKRSEYTATRLLEFAYLAAKLRHAGCKVWLTVTGLGCEPPPDVRPKVEEWDNEAIEAYEEWTEECLADLGIFEECNFDPSRMAHELPSCWLNPYPHPYQVNPLPNPAPAGGSTPGDCSNSPEAQGVVPCGDAITVSP